MKLTAEDESDLEGRWEYVNEGGMNMILRYKGPTKDRDVVASSMLGSQVSTLVVKLMMPMCTCARDRLLVAAVGAVFLHVTLEFVIAS